MCAEIIDSGSNREHLARELTAPWVVRNDFGSVEVRLQLHGECGQNQVTRRTDGGKSISSNNITTCNNNTKTLKKFSLGPLSLGKWEHWPGCGGGGQSFRGTVLAPLL